MINVLKYLENTHSGVKEDSMWAIVSAKCEWREKCEENCKLCDEDPCNEDIHLLKGHVLDFALNTKECKDCINWWDFRGKKNQKKRIDCAMKLIDSKKEMDCFEPRIIKGKVTEAIRFEKASYCGMEGIIDKKNILSPEQHLWIINQGLKDGDYILLELELVDGK
jgi:hypothetical protein